MHCGGHRPESQHGHPAGLERSTVLVQSPFTLCWSLQHYKPVLPVVPDTGIARRQSPCSHDKFADVNGRSGAPGGVCVLPAEPKHKRPVLQQVRGPEGRPRLAFGRPPPAAALALPSCSRLCPSSARRFAGPYEFKAPVELNAETENAFRLLTLKAPPPQTQPFQPRRQPTAAGPAPPQQPQQQPFAGSGNR